MRDRRLKTLRKLDNLVAVSYTHLDVYKRQVGDTLSLEAQLEGAEAAAANAARNYDLTTLRAPFAGKVVGLQIAEGTFAVAGHPLFSLIKSDAWYAIADFRETELPRITVGDRATVWTLSLIHI